MVQHDPETPECSPGGADGNYIMYARATSGDRPNNNKFSSCSKKSMADVLRLKARGLDGCFIRMTIICFIAYVIYCFYSSVVVGAELKLKVLLFPEITIVVISGLSITYTQGHSECRSD
jgi:hypothetical protein